MSPVWVDNKKTIKDYTRDIEYKYSNFNNSFTMEEFDRAIQVVKVKSSLGPDGIEYRMVKELSTGLKKNYICSIPATKKENHLRNGKKSRRFSLINRKKK